MELMGMVKDISSLLGCITIIITLIKPIRKIVINWINRQTGTSAQNQTLEEIKSELKKITEDGLKRNERLELHHQIHLLSLRNRITNLFYKYNTSDALPGFERNNLVAHYKLYKQLGGNGEIEDMYNRLMKMDVKDMRFDNTE